MSQPQSLTESLMEASVQFEPVFESAKGMRLRLEADGWTPAVAEAIAAQWLVSIIGRAIAGPVA